MATSSSKLEGFLKVNIRDFLEKWRWYQWNPSSNYGTSSTSKKGTFTYFSQKLLQPSLAHFTQFQGKNPRDGTPTRGRDTPKHHGEVLPSIGTTLPRHIVKMPHNPPVEHFHRGRPVKMAPSLMVFNEPNGNPSSCREPHQSSHTSPTSIYEQSISTNSFPASNTA